MFGTGVTIVTTRDADGMPVGMTANSFNSVSLEPPIILWSIARTARSCKAFVEARFWNVHVLSVEHEALSRRFACQGADKFAGLETEEGLAPIPLLRGCSARFQCEAQHAYEAGDHVVLFGRVIGFDQSDRPPLLWVAGNYAIATPRAPDIATRPGALEAGLFSENLLGFLLSRAHLLYMHSFRPALAAQGLTDADFYVLTLIGVRRAVTAASLITHLGFTGVDISRRTLEQLLKRELVWEDRETGFALTDRGRDLLTGALGACRAVQENVEAQVGALQIASLRNLLKQVIQATDPGLPAVWE
jgi:3-hydroxy-9,10-secoandrosta-1,3,5(10)-triene-9,17-dione monooxygenase reductase component